MQVRDHHRCTLDGEALSDLLPDAARGAGYDSKLPAKLWHCATPSRSNLGFARSEWCNSTGEIIVDDFAQSERQIGDQAYFPHVGDPIWREFPPISAAEKHLLRRQGAR